MNIQTSVLANGISFLHVPLFVGLNATILLLVRVGSRDESKLDGGISHFIEHMIFKGTKTRPSSRIIGMEVEKIGGSSNAFTSYDYTGFYIKVPVSNYAKSIEILADMVSNSIFPEADILKEKGVVVEEIRMYNDQPTSKVVQLWNKNFFGENSLGRDIAGTVESVAGITQGKIFKFIDKHYTTGNMLLVFAGNVDYQKVLENANLCFCKKNKGTSYKGRSLKKLNKRTKIYNKYKDLEQSHLVIGGYGFERNWRYKFHLQLFEAILSKGFGSRLFQKIREEMGLAYYVYSRFRSLNDIGVFQIGLGVENSKIQLAVEATMQEFQDLLDGNFDDEEFERAQNYLLGNIVTDMETTEDYALWYGLSYLMRGRYYTLREVADMIKKLTKDEVVLKAREIFSGQNFQFASVSPHKKFNFDLQQSLKVK
jgi:predicted Zn-dependent peptidase